MSIYFENEQMEAARALAEEIRGEIDPKLSVTENMIRSLRMRTVDLDAEAVVRDLNTGIRNFHEAYEDAFAQGLENMIIRNVDKILDNRTEQEQRELLMGILRNYADATDSAVPEEMDLETMKQTACYCISEYSLILTGSEAFRQMAELDEQTVAAITEASVSAQEEGYAALAIYLLHAAGKMEAEGMTSEQIGAMTAATLAAHRAVQEAAEAEVENETQEQTETRYAKLKKALKIIGSALAIALILRVIALSIWGSVAVAAAGLQGMIVSGSFVEFLYCVPYVLAGLFSMGLILTYGTQKGVQVAKGSDIADSLVAAYRKGAEFVTETLVPQAKLFWEVLRETVLQKIALYRGVEVTADITQEPVVKEPEDIIVETKPVEKVEVIEEEEKEREEEEEEELDA